MRRQRQEGIALLLALLFVAVLAALIVEFCYEAQVETSYVANHVDEMQARVAAESGIALGLSLLKMDLDDSTQNGSPQYDSLQDNWAMGVPFEKLNEAVMQCAIDDEYGKLNVNAVFFPDMFAQGQDAVNPTGDKDTAQNGDGRVVAQEAQRSSSSRSAGLDTQGQLDSTIQRERNEAVIEALRVLFQARGAEDDPVDAILDWIDQDDDTETEGAERDYYEGLDTPYSCKNGPLDSVEELLLIRGITPELFWGDPEKNELPLTELITVHGDPLGRININTAAWETLDAAGQALGLGALADQVIRDRDQNPFMDAADLEGRGLVTRQQTTKATGKKVTREGATTTAANPPGQGEGQGAGQSPFVVQSSVFRIRGHGLVGLSAVRVEAYVWRDASYSAEPFRILDWRIIE